MAIGAHPRSINSEVGVSLFSLTPSSLSLTGSEGRPEGPLRPRCRAGMYKLRARGAFAFGDSQTAAKSSAFVFFLSRTLFILAPDELVAFAHRLRGGEHGAGERNNLEPEPRDATSAPVPLHRPAGGVSLSELP